jgi:hypothetical protein
MKLSELEFELRLLGFEIKSIEPIFESKSFFVSKEDYKGEKIRFSKAPNDVEKIMKELGTKYNIKYETWVQIGIATFDEYYKATLEVYDLEDD